ncbi:uncharacterized protein LOC114523494 [Dendronephthya gigantea]|uniref:uncharacterized protein LOC114523494 n=1 Tax=Dendronephthya gigantea TaxID=151771 RepID=UPI00106A83C4|nr:uncharacterized protein LOC114523494 [Dendronephthya gigantea]
MADNCCCLSLFKCKRESQDGEGDKNEKSPLITSAGEQGNESGYQTTGTTDSQGSPNSQQHTNNGLENSRRAQPPKSVKIERIQMKPLTVRKVDEIFQKFQKTFDEFNKCQIDMQDAMKKFQTACNSEEDFRACLVHFKEQLKGQRVVIKKLALKFPKTVQVNDAKALTSIFKTYEDLEKLSVKVISKSIECFKDVMSLDESEVAGEEFRGSGYDFEKLPEPVKSMRANVKELKKAPKIVKDFFEYANSIVNDVIEELGEDKNREELKKRTEKVAEDLEKKIESFTKVAEGYPPPEEIHFTSLGIPDVDRLFNDVAKLVNPVVKLSIDMFNARKRVEQAAKAVSEFRDDPSKAFDDYLEDLKKRLRKGQVHIVISVNGNHVKVEKVEGLEPKAMQDMRDGFNGVLKSGGELVDLFPDSIQKLIKLSKDILDISVTDIKNHIKSLKELKSTMTALKDNAKKAEKIPDDLKFFFNFVRNLVMDILQLLHTKKEETQASQEETTTD